MLRGVIATILLLPAAAGAAEMTCKKSPALIGKCTTVQGSLGLTPGLGVTLNAEDGTRTIIKAPPDSNADIAPTLAHLIGAILKGPGTLTGRVAQEAFTGAKAVPFQRKSLASDPAPNGQRTVLQYQEVGGVRYFDAAGIPGRTVGLAGAK